ncbi:MAG TPA: hypothetical protein VFN26_21555 [Candidatus Acidoferrum sp.]|nr:hypothetical protein [Candidatus Acidoferrum sp.]
MLGPADWVIWALSMFFEASVVVCSLYRKSFRRYFFLNLYMLISFVVSVGTFRVLTQYGRSSLEYRYFYFYSEALLIISLYFALISLYSRVLHEMRVERYLRMGAVLLLAGTACFSYAVVSQSSHRMLTYFVFELCQNLYFVGLVLTYALWGAILKLRETRALLVQLVLSLGVYFSAYAASYAISNLRPDLYSYVYRLFPLMGCLLPLAWAYAIWRVPEGARLVPARLAAVPR